MSSLFDPSIPIFKRNEINKAQLENLKKRYAQYDPAYVANACFEERRIVLEQAYSTCHLYLDDNFTLEICQHDKFIDRVWELCLCQILLNQGYQLEKQTSKGKGGPDFCILIEGKKIWIEAVCPNLGDIDPVEPPPILEPGKIYTFGGKVDETLRPRAIRVSHSLEKKKSRRVDYIESGLIGADDPYIIAVNTSRINHHSSEEMLEELVLYGMGLQVINFTGESYRQFVQSIKKRTPSGDVDIPMALLLRPEYIKIPAVIFFRTWFDFEEDWVDNLPKSATTYFNPKSEIELDPVLIKFGTKKKVNMRDNGFELTNIL